MIILGAGLNGCIAAMRFPEARILEYLPTPTVHKAVLRFRSDAVSDLTGIPFKKVSVQKAIVVGNDYVQPSIKLSNLYSRKVSGKATARSIDNLEPTERWIAPDDFHAQMLTNLRHRITVGSDYIPNKLDEPIISTIPLPIMCNKLGIDSPLAQAESAKPIYIRTIEFQSADVYQTIYYPDHAIGIYRASMTGSMLIIESIAQITSRDCMKVIEHFGLSGMIHTFGEETIQKFGKFIPLEGIKRKKLMLSLTRDHGIYSLGRHATWRKLLLDDSIKDMDVIERLIAVDEYDLRVGK
jgi:hypothetical protein